MHFEHTTAVWDEFPELVVGVLAVDGIRTGVDVGEQVARFCSVAAARLAGGSETELPEVQAWRRAYSRMGLKPTQYRCASESLLRRFRKEGGLPRIHPLIDLCNAVSLAFAIPVAVFDLAEVSGDLQVRHAVGDETYLTFGGDTETPPPGEVVFADGAGRAHARRWVNRQSGLSAVRATTSSVLIVAESQHPTAVEDTDRLVAALSDELAAVWDTKPDTAVLSAAAPRFEVRP